MHLYDIQTDSSTLWVFDNDGTLYRDTKIVEMAVMEKMFTFIAEHYGIENTQVALKREELCKKHNTRFTLVALSKEGIRPETFIKNTYLAIEPTVCGVTGNHQLRDMLLRIGGEKMVLTNNPAPFARMILDALGVEDLFSSIYGMLEMDFVLKPHPNAFRVIKSVLEGGRSVVFIDDEFANIATAASLGCTCVFVGSHKDIPQTYRGFITPTITDEVVLVG